MPADSVRTDTGVTVSIARDPSLVRTVRLVAAAVARRSSSGEELVEEVRLAVGEACALLVGGEAPVGTSRLGPVEVSMRIADRLRVVVRADGPISAHDAPTGDVDGVEPWGLLRGLIDDFVIRSDEDSTTLSMSWALD